MRQDSKALIYLVIGLAVAAVSLALAALQILPPETGASEEVWQHYYHSGGMVKALLLFLSAATAIGAVLSFCLMLLTILRFDKGL